MNKTLLLLFLVFFGIELHAQSNDEIGALSLELALGVSDVGINSDDNFIVGRIQCFDCDYQELINEGYEINSRLTINKIINFKHEFIVGMGFNLWRYDIDLISGWTGQVIDTKVKNLGFVGVTAGYRYSIFEWGRASLFIEGTMHAEVNNSNDFKNFKFSLAPAMGVKFKVNERIKLITSLSYKRPLTNIATHKFSNQKPHSLGIHLGVNRSIN